jgi:glycosyltransferase involved in cell wall biosynthesis
MRILQLHNRYRHQGGEERAVADITTLLRRHGHQVEVLERASEYASSAAAARGLLTGGLRPSEVADAVRRSGAEVVHAHNLHPLLGWRALAAAREAGARTVLHLHNFRLFCAIAIAYRNGERCFRCRGVNTLPGLRLRCRGSVPEAAVYAAGLALQQRRLLEHADQLVAVSGATLARLRSLGLPDGNSVALANFVLDEGFAPRSQAAEGTYALATGRLVEEKGFDTAIAAAHAASVPLVIAGDGPDEARLRALAGTLGPAEVRFAGHVPPDELARLRAGAAMVLAPSRWEEPCPYSVLDAFAAGVPVLGSDRGGLPEIVGAEAVVAAEDPAAWTEALSQLWGDPGLRAARGTAALERARRQHGEGGFLERLMQIYVS